MANDILIVDDEEDIRLMIAGILEDEGYAPRMAKNSDEALAEIKKHKPELIIQDVWLEDSVLDGLEILENVQKFDKELPIIMISGHGTIEMAVKALHLGAYDFIEKPFKSDKFLILVKRALETFSLKKENKELRQKTNDIHISQFNGPSQKMRQVQQIIERVAPTESRVLITGAPGTGKDIAARQIHQKSERSQGQFVVLNCALMTPERLDEELFGIERGDKIIKRGLLEQADKGTLFLDEVADMPLETQAKILNVLTNQSFTRIGGQKRLDVDARIIAATNQNLKEKIEKKKFREDLYYRLNVVPLNMPDLHERREDIPELIAFFAEKICLSNKIKPMHFSEETVVFLKKYKWQGNIRQLRNIVEWSIIVNAGLGAKEITLEMLPAEIKGNHSASSSNDNPEFLQVYSELMAKPLRDARNLFEREYLKSQIDRFDGNISKTAEFVGMERSALHRKIKSLGINDDEDQKSHHETEDTGT